MSKRQSNPISTRLLGAGLQAGDINGIGLRESVFVFFFSAFGVIKYQAIAFAWLAYGLVILQGLLGGIVYALRR